jgi:hypothetical protein
MPNLWVSENFRDMPREWQVPGQRLAPLAGVANVDSMLQHSRRVELLNF